MKSEALVPTPDSQSALKRLCDHFRDDHDFDVAALADRAKITFAEGVCAIRADTDGLQVRLKVWDEDLRANTEAFVARHLQRLVTRSRDPVGWTRVSGEGAAAEDAPTLQLRLLASVLDQAAALEQRV